MVGNHMLRWVFLGKCLNLMNPWVNRIDSGQRFLWRTLESPRAVGVQSRWDLDGLPSLSQTPPELSWPTSFTTSLVVSWHGAAKTVCNVHGSSRKKRTWVMSPVLSGPCHPMPCTTRIRIIMSYLGMWLHLSWSISQESITYLTCGWFDHKRLINYGAYPEEMTRLLNCYPYNKSTGPGPQSGMDRELCRYCEAIKSADEHVLLGRTG